MRNDGDIELDLEDEPMYPSQFELDRELIRQEFGPKPPHDAPQQEQSQSRMNLGGDSRENSRIGGGSLPPLPQGRARESRGRRAARRRAASAAGTRRRAGALQGAVARA